MYNHTTVALALEVYYTTAEKSYLSQQVVRLQWLLHVLVTWQAVWEMLNAGRVGLLVWFADSEVFHVMVLEGSRVDYLLL